MGVPARLGFGWRHCATGVHKLMARYPAPLKSQCQRCCSQAQAKAKYIASVSTGCTYSHYSEQMAN